MREPFKDLKLTFRLWRDDKASEADERFKAGFVEYPSACSFGRTADEALRRFGWILSDNDVDPMTVKNLKRAAHRHAAECARRNIPKSISRKKRRNDD